MKFRYVLPLMALFVLLQVNAQKNVHSYVFKKGEVFDVMLLTQTKAANAAELFEHYKQTAFPVAAEYSYQSLKGFGVLKLTLGTNNADALLFGKWESLNKREAFLESITKRVPDFHQQRRILFPDFRLTYYEIPQDIKFSVDKSKYNVVTSFWKPSDKNNSTFLKEWQSEVLRAGGTFILTLKNGISPLGYYYNPDVLNIVQWESEAAFKSFSEKYPLPSYEEFTNVHQFVI